MEIIDKRVFKKTGELEIGEVFSWINNIYIALPEFDNQGRKILNATYFTVTSLDMETTVESLDAKLVITPKQSH